MTYHALKDAFRTYQAQLKAYFAPSHLAIMRPQMHYQASALAVFALLASFILGLGDFITRDVIAQRIKEDLQKSVEEVIPFSFYDNRLLDDAILIPVTDQDGLGKESIMVYLAKKVGQVEAVCFQLIAPDGYAGPIHLVMGIDREGHILGVRIVSHTETPGLGDKIEIKKSKWVLDFEGKSLENVGYTRWEVKKDGGIFDQFAGATITPRKVVQVIKRGLIFFQKHKDVLLTKVPK